MILTRLPAIVFLALCCAATTATAQGPDELWELTSKMEMAGMPGMPAQTSQYCKRKGDTDPSKMGQDKNSDCKVTDVKQSGSKSSWKVVCTKPEPMTGVGEVTHTGDKFSGTIKMTGKMDGEAYSMTQVMSGRKVGNCTYEDPAKKMQQMQAQSQAMIDKECDKSIEDLEPALVFGGEGLPPEYQACKHRKADYCARTTKVTQPMRDPASFAAVNGKHKKWRESLQACGTDPATISGPVCKSAAGKKDWTFVAENCPAEARALAQKHCAGLDYTSVMSSEYRDICQKHGADLAKENVATEKAEAKKEAAPAPKTDKEKAVDAVKEGTNKLKKLLKF